MPSFEGKNQVNNIREHSDHRFIFPSQDRSPKFTGLHDVEYQGEREMEETKGRLVEWFNEPDFFLLKVLLLLIFRTYKYVLKHLVKTSFGLYWIALLSSIV